MIKKITTKEEIKSTANIIQQAFITVVKDLNLTKENSPTNPAFITIEKLTNEIKNKPIEYFGYFIDNKQVGVVAMEKNSNELYYLERLGVIPEQRHKKIGQKLIEFVKNYAHEKGGNKISIGIINENTTLKNWYENIGFKETAIKKFEHLPFTVCFMEIAL